MKLEKKEQIKQRYKDVLVELIANNVPYRTTMQMLKDENLLPVELSLVPGAYKVEEEVEFFSKILLDFYEALCSDGGILSARDIFHITVHQGHLRGLRDNDVSIYKRLKVTLTHLQSEINEALEEISKIDTVVNHTTSYNTLDHRNLMTDLIKELVDVVLVGQAALADVSAGYEDFVRNLSEKTIYNVENRKIKQNGEGL